MRILIVEDEEKTATFLSKGLAENTFAVDVANTGSDGLKLATENDYSLAILDVMLPGIDGWEILGAGTGGRRLPATWSSSSPFPSFWLVSTPFSAGGRHSSPRCCRWPIWSSISHTRISERIWNMTFESETNVVDVHMRRLRAKVDDPYEKKLIHTVQRLGYVLEDR